MASPAVHIQNTIIALTATLLLTEDATDRALIKSTIQELEADLVRVREGM